MAYLIIGVIIISLVIFLVVYVIAPLGGILLTIALVSGVGYGLYTSIASFASAIQLYKDPYKTYVDKSPKAPPGIRRNYFFGPGFHQIITTVREAFSQQSNRLEPLEDWKDDHLSFEWYKDMWVWIFYYAAILFTFVFGFAWITVFSLVLSVILLIGMGGFYIFFMSLWGIDRLILMYRAIQSRCPHCKRISVIPTFICPECGTEHKDLTPGPYGVLIRRCNCGKQLSTTFITGRSEYNAKCPFCGSELVASDAQQFGIQLVGGISTGKTTFLAAFWHEYLEKLSQIPGVIITASPKEAFDDLEYWYQHGYSSATTEFNANMYNLIHKTEDRTPIQMTIYDIAGEAFSLQVNEIQQQQYNYCEGIVFVVDPTSDPSDVSETFSTFINEFRGLKGSHPTKTSDVPVVVLITKADLHKKEIGLPKIKSTFKSKPQVFTDSEGNMTIDLVRNGLCKDFLEKHGFGNSINLIDAEFNKVQFFSVSAMGHQPISGERYEPWGVLEPIIWLMIQQGELFQDVVSQI